MSGTYDAIVLGAGPAGLIAAITAHDMGAKVCVMEKCDRPDGNAIYALGSVCGWGTRHQKEQGITDTADAFYAMMMDISKQMGDPALNRTYTDNISAGIDWLEKDIGVKFGKIRPMPYPRLGRTCRVVGDKSKGMTGALRSFKSSWKPAPSAVLKSSTSIRPWNFSRTKPCRSRASRFRPRRASSISVHAAAF